MYIRKMVTVGIIALAFTQTAFAQGLAQDVDSLEAQVAALETQNEELLAVIEGLIALQRCHAIGGAAGRTFSENGTLGVDWRGCDKRGILLRGPLVPVITDNALQYEMNALLVNARLVGTDFTGAYIIGVAMNGSNLEGADLTNANLRYSNLTGAVIVKATQAAAYGRAQTIFSNTICPDNSNSDEDDGDEYTCANNRTAP
jgi:uncharacterized protein YjbI with pentapeptide repeats